MVALQQTFSYISRSINPVLIIIVNFCPMHGLL